MSHTLLGLRRLGNGLYACPEADPACPDLCPRCNQRIGMRGNRPERALCSECFHETHRMCLACCWKDAGQDEGCDHYYRRDCPECHGAGWFPLEAARAA